MVATSFIAAASGLFALAYGAPVSSRNNARSLVERAAYKVYGGDGSVAQGWPSVKDWVDYDKMWEANQKTMEGSCTQFFQENNSKEEIADIKDAIEKVSKESGVDKRYILAIIMQESKGCVRVWTTNYGVRNPGLMQDHDGPHSCNDNPPDSKTPGKNPCPQDQIEGMIADGVGTDATFGLKKILSDAKAKGGDDDSKYYKGARMYNSGSIDASGNLGKGIATHCYATDVANRLTGWTDQETSGCKEDTIGSVEGSKGGNTQTPPPTGTTTPSKPSQTATPAQTGAPSTGNGDATPSGPKAPGAAAGCKKWYTVKSGDDCSSVESKNGLASGTLQKLNTGLNAQCTNLFLGTSYCTAA